MPAPFTVVNQVNEATVYTVDGSGNTVQSGSATVSGAVAVTGVTSFSGGTSTASSAPVLTTTFANGTAAQLADTARDYQLYLTVGTAGSAFSVAMGATSAVANTVISSNTPNSGESISVRLPAGWFFKWAGTSTTLANQIAIGC